MIDTQEFSDTDSTAHRGAAIIDAASASGTDTPESLRARSEVSFIDEFLRGLDIVVEECDWLDAKVLVREAARSVRSRRRAHVPGQTPRYS